MDGRKKNDDEHQVGKQTETRKEQENVEKVEASCASFFLEDPGLDGLGKAVPIGQLGSTLHVH